MVNVRGSSVAIPVKYVACNLKADSKEQEQGCDDCIGRGRADEILGIIVLRQCGEDEKDERDHGNESPVLGEIIMECALLHFT